MAAYVHQRKDKAGEELVGALIDQLYGRMDVALPLSWAEGLYGIAYGMTWLLANGLMEGDVNEVLSEVDARIMERSPKRIKDYGWGHVLAGLLYYVLYRLKYWQEQGVAQQLPFDPEYLEALEEGPSDKYLTISEKS